MPISHTPNLTALMIIADEDRRYSLDKPLRRSGFKLRDAMNGEDGLRLAMEVPDLILLDLSLPDMTGFEVCCRLKAHMATADIPVLHLSNHPVEGSEFAQHLECGDDAYLTYPVEEAELLSFVNTLIRGRQIQRQFSSFLEAAPDAVVISDQEGRIVRVNGQTEELFGHGREELIGSHIEILLPERFRDSHRNHRDSFMAHPSTRTMGRDLQLWGLRKDGREFPVEIRLSPLPNHEGILVACIIRDVTERRKSEMALENALAYADDIISTLREPFVVLDLELRVKTANIAFCNAFHVTKEETEGRLIFDLGNGQWDIVRLRILLTEVLTLDHSVQDFKVERDFPNLGRKTMLLNACRFLSTSKASELILLAMEDITEKAVVEATLRESEERYRRVVELMPAAVYTVDAAGVINFYNQNATTLWGRSPQLGDADERFCGATRLFQRDGTPMPHAQTPVATTLQDGLSIRDREVIIERANGSRVSVRVNIAPIRDSADKIVGAINVFEDVTERNLAEVALLDSEIRYRRLFETAKDGILILDTITGRITDANPFMGELLGYSHEHFLGKELWEIGLFSDKSANEAAVRHLQEKGYIRYEHMPLETSNGQRVEVEVVANAYHEDHHKVIQCNIRDITERSRLETERDRLEFQMRGQAVALEDLHRRKDEFLAMLSHELRNPLSPIASALQLLGLQKNEEPLQQKARTIIERQVGQLTRLIDDLLEVSRITTGRIHLQQERVVLNGIVEHAVETVRPLIVRHKHALTVSLPKEPIWLFADAARLEQVVVNLLTNAAKFTHDSGQIWLGVQHEGDECVLRVKDNGIGIAPETLPHVFDLFTQAERSLARSQGGLGIGLALVQRIVEMHKGRVEAISRLGQGAEFIVHLPKIAAETNHSSLTNRECSQANEHSLRIMVVDDNEDAAQMLGMLLLRSGHEVLTVHDGPSTLTAAQDFLPNVILLDIGLPGMDGFEVAKKIRQQEIFKNVVLVAMTGYGQDADRQRSKAAGFDHHLVKPPDFNKLEQILTTVSEKVGLMLPKNKPPEPFDVVQEASEESFPASDSPAY